MEPSESTVFNRADLGAFAAADRWGMETRYWWIKSGIARIR